MQVFELMSIDFRYNVTELNELTGGSNFANKCLDAYGQ